jgi:hypothetical protein
VTRPALTPPGTWPPRMPVEMAAGYCGEVSAEVFLRQVRAGTSPAPVIKRGRRQIWAKADLDQAIASHGNEIVVDVAADL